MTSLLKDINMCSCRTCNSDTCTKDHSSNKLLHSAEDFVLQLTLAHVGGAGTPYMVYGYLTWYMSTTIMGSSANTFREVAALGSADWRSA